MRYMQSLNVSTVALNQQYTYWLVGPTGVSHSSYAGYWQSPAHIIFRNDSSASFGTFTDHNGYGQELAPNSTTVIVLPPTSNYVILSCWSTVSTNGTPTGVSNNIYVSYYEPGEELPHPLGR